jgi:hypothetical protein
LNFADLRARLELAAAHKPALRKLLTGDIRTREDLDAIATATAELGFFELSFLVRAIASGEEHMETGLAKLARFASNMSDAEIVDQVADRIEDPELAAIIRTAGKFFR